MTYLLGSIVANASSRNTAIESRSDKTGGGYPAKRGRMASFLLKTYALSDHPTPEALVDGILKPQERIMQKRLCVAQPKEVRQWLNVHDRSWA